MTTQERVQHEVTMAEALGMTSELGEAIAGIAEAELVGGRAETARTILEGLVVTNPRDLSGWVLLSRTHRSLGQPLAARFCAEVAFTLGPEEPAAMLAKAEALLGDADERPAATALLARLAALDAPEARRASALLAAVGA
jgi:cytochrome c-type biogenesis protein CcmH/NrfG